jgi:hypothetical protein
MNKKATPVYLDDTDKEKLGKIAEYYGVSQSAAIQRLIREKELPTWQPIGADINVALLPFAEVMDFTKLPKHKGIYFVINGLGNLLYIGKAEGQNGLRGRWNKVRANEYKGRGATSIRYAVLPKYQEDEIVQIEQNLIKRLSPEWNIKGNYPEADLSYLESSEWKNIAENY